MRAKDLLNSIIANEGVAIVVDGHQHGSAIDIPIQEITNVELANSTNYLGCGFRLMEIILNLRMKGFRIINLCLMEMNFNFSYMTKMEIYTKKAIYSS